MSFLQERSRAFFNALRRISCVGAVLTLSACANMPDFSVLGGKFEPLNSDIASAAAPYNPAAARAAGDVSCRIGKGSARFSTGWLDIKSVDFALPPTARSVDIPVQAAKKNSQMVLEGYYDPAGQKMIFCPVSTAAPGARVACTSLYALEDDLRMGIKRTFDVPDAIRSAAITCAYAAQDLKKL